MAISGMLQKGPLASILYKESVSTRGFYWRAAYEMFVNNVYTGVGLDRYGYFFKQFREPDYVVRYGTDIGSSNAHNVILQLFATGGIFVGLAYLTLLGIILSTGIKQILHTTGDIQKLSLILFSAWLGFQAQAFISIDNLAISVWGWLIGGSIIGLSRNSSNEHTGRDLQKTYKKNCNIFNSTK
jgi:O-antigen ligase